MRLHLPIAGTWRGRLPLDDGYLVCIVFKRFHPRKQAVRLSQILICVGERIRDLQTVCKTWLMGECMSSVQMPVVHTMGYHLQVIELSNGDIGKQRKLDMCMRS